VSDTVNILIGTDSLHPPLTGIGRYTRELCLGLIDREGVDSIHGYDLGTQHSVQDRLRTLDQADAKERQATNTRSLRKLAAGSVLGITLYRYYLSLQRPYKLPGSRDVVYHFPNFHLPRVSGPSVVTVHDMTHRLYPDYHPRARVSWLNQMLPRAVRQSDHIICVSESTRTDLLREFDFADSKTSVIYPGVSDVFRRQSSQQTQATLSQFGLSHGSYFLVVSTMEPRKNIEALLDAYLALPGELRDAYPLVLAGVMGWMCEGIKARLEALQGSQVIYLGYVSEQQLPVLYSGALCFVYPSFYEGFGLPLLEAQASGVPLITSNTSSLPEVAGPDAMLVNPRDIDELSGRLRKAAEDSEWRARCAASGLAYARQFSWQRCVGETLEVYRSLLR